MFDQLVLCGSCKSINRKGDTACSSCATALPDGVDDGAQTETMLRVPEIVAASEASSPLPELPEHVPPPRSDSARMAKLTKAWLCCDPLPPVPLGPKLRVVIGRSEDCDLRLRHPAISRHQCVVKVQGDSFTVEDQGSSNGTFLNGKLVSTAKLQSGDLLTFGPFEVHVRSNDQMSQLSQELDDLARTGPIGSTRLITGLLPEISLAELLQGLEFNRKSGTLKILSGHLRGSLVIRDGRPLRAALGANQDAEAVLRMLLMTEGRVTFTPDVEEGEDRMSERITNLLFEASRRVDEAGRPGG